MNYKCEKCKLQYVTHNGLWKHNKKYHGNDCMKNESPCLPDMGDTQKEIKKFICKICKKSYENRNSKYKHQKICSENTNNIKQLEIKFTDEINKLKSEINNKVNKKTINNNNYGVINNITINKMGNENLSLLNDNEITMIFNKELESITTFIELLNFNERLPENHNHCTTSLESKYLSVYNSETNKVEKDRKKYFFDKLLNTSVDKIQILYNTNKNKFSKTKQKQIEENIKHLKSFKNYDFNNKILKEMINKMNLITYNKRALVQKTWHEDSDSEDDFQKDLDKSETKAEFYKKMEMKEKLALEAKYEEESITESSITEKKLEIKSKSKKPAIILKHTTVSSDSDNDDDIFLEVYNN